VGGLGDLTAEGTENTEKSRILSTFDAAKTEDEMNGTGRNGRTDEHMRSEV
jgi:hypothetical protein